jgi:colicin import membrane protein
MNDTQGAETMAPLLDAITSAPTTDLVVIPRAELIFVPGGAEKVLSSIKAKARAEAAKLDVSRPRDRDTMRSLAYKLRRLKTTGDDSGKDLKAEYDKKIKPIDAERRVWRSEMDELIAEIIAPAEEFDAREDARIKAHEDAITEIAAFGTEIEHLSSAALRGQIDQLDHLHPVRDWQEFQPRASFARTTARNALRLALIDAEAREKEEAEEEERRIVAEVAHQAELKRLQAEREAEIARQAAETARAAAEQVAAEEAARVAREAAEREAAAKLAAQRADYHRRMLQHVKNCGFGFIDEQPQPLGILQHELTTKIKYDEENFGDLLGEAITARDDALKAIQRSIDESVRRAAEEEARIAALAKAEREAKESAERAERAEAQREANRIAAHEAALQAMDDASYCPPGATSDTLRAVLAAFVARPEREWDEYAERAATDHAACIKHIEACILSAEAREAAEAERQQKLAEQKAEALRLAAIEEERRRHDAETAETARQARLREADKEHRRKFNGEAVTALTALGFTSGQCKTIIEAVARGGIPHMRMDY